MDERERERERERENYGKRDKHGDKTVKKKWGGGLTLTLILISMLFWQPSFSLFAKIASIYSLSLTHAPSENAVTIIVDPSSGHLLLFLVHT